ncbi:ATP-binding cassette sub-family C member 4-like isoform X1 [Schistocerca piceifrons]|uniref:ATP-binding cassette sub-family C member 4-like isoform X1 n=1 Tax=Schistocerca piceifrons TaxID=274613 RepID=UPI001F5FDF81|nr:ATP-binding cassette sub-family C member 4-like isoform X1 [Schistocerca piceifrons]
MDAKTYKSKPNPKKGANPFSRAVLWWLRKLIWKSYKKGITEDDLYERLEEDCTQDLGDRLEKSWDKELTRAKEKGKKPNFARALFSVFWFMGSWVGVFMFIEHVIVRTMQSVLLAKIIEFFSPGSDTTIEEAYGYSAGLIGAVLVRIFCWHHYSKETQFVGMRMRVACCSLIYRKVLRLSRQTMDNTATGYIVNLMTNDLSRFDRVIMWAHFLWVPFLQIPIVMYWLHSFVGWSSFVGVASVFLITLPSQHITGRLSAKYRKEVAIRTDERMKLMNEIVSGMRVIKMYGWEMPFAKLVAQSRKSEISRVSRTSYLRNLVLALEFLVDRTALFTTLLAYWLAGGVSTAAEVFAMSQFFYGLNLILGIVVPIAVNFVGETRVSVNRIQEFLLKPEVCDVVQDDGLQRGEVSLSRATASWDGSHSSLSAVSLRILPGQLCALVGAVGSGKSSVLQALLGELQPSEGRVSLNGRVAYASQEPWVFAGTVRNNILLGRPYQHEWYRKVVRACALERDFQLLPRGDGTVVGQKGATLSGGQRARINLARAVYGDADIYLLDDPLSAVDTHVGKHLFEQCVCSLLSNKTRILVTHQIQHLHAASNIIVLNEGKVEDQGTFKELTERSKSFSVLLSSADEDESPGESGTPELQEYEFRRLSRLSLSLSKRASSVSTMEEDIRRSSRLSISQKNTELFKLGMPGSPSPPDTDDEVLEEAVDSRVLWRSLWGYARSAGGCCLLLTVAAVIVATQAVTSLCDYWLSYWTAAEEQRSLGHGEEVPSSTWFVSAYGAIVAFVILLSTARALGFAAMCMRASRRLHNWMFERVLRSPIRFFDTNPAGRILNRFSKDIGAIDELLPFPTLDMIQIFLCMFGIIILVLISQYIVIVPLAVVSVFFIWLSVMFISTGRNVKQLEGIRRSPVFSHLSDTLNGLATVRSARVQEMVKHEFDAHQDRHTSAWFLYVCSGTALGLWLDLLSVVYVTLVTFSFLVINSDSVAGSNVGLAVSQSLLLTGMLQYGVLQLNEMVSQATSIERVLEYTRLPPEPALESEGGKKPPNEWPSKGEIVFKDVSLRYGEIAPPVLKAVNFIIAPTHKVGIVGRTGAGKSSLIAALFRLTPVEGAVVIDGIDSSTIGLHDLRRRISIIPQEPVLFSASMRFNLDPFQEFDDAKLWDALEEVELKQAVGSLDAQVTEGGGNLSVGQRQLVCLARAILRNNKVLVLDEATANVDTETDTLIQKTIRRKFKECTVLTIAHRLNTIMDSDRVLVMDAGQVAEYGTPHELLQRSEGILTAMVRQTGPAMERQLRAVAQETYLKDQPEIESVRL